MADSYPVAVKKCDSGAVSSVSMDIISTLTELEDLERVYQQLCAEEVCIKRHKRQVSRLRVDLPRKHPGHQVNVSLVETPLLRIQDKLK